MKKILASLTLFTLAGILLSSCSNSSKLAITKRHYRSGYYVDFSRRRTIPTVAKIVPDNKHKSVSVTSKPENQVTVNTSAAIKQDIFQNISLPAKPQINNAANTNLTTADKNISVANSNNVSETPIFENKQTLSEGNGGGDRASERDALSLLWIVIVVILILWLIGIIAGGFGLGGLINLLLLIALILFILWLLRVW